MRVVLALAIVLCGGTAALAAPPLPTPTGCADYQSNASGVADDACNTAIAQESDPQVKSMLLFRRAYIEDAPGDFSKYAAALADLDAALALFAQNWAALHERAYIYNEYGRWQDAVNDLDAQIALAPDVSTAYRERALSRFKLGDLQGTYDDRDTTIRLGEKQPGAFLARALAAMWLGKFAAAQSDIEAAQQIATQLGDKASADQATALSADLAVWSTTSGAAPAAACATAEAPQLPDDKNLIGDCTRAFLDATTPKAKADALTWRGTAWLRLAGNEGAWVTDFTIAAALDPGNAGAHSNLGYGYIRLHHAAAAIQEFDRAIAIAPAFFSYAGRAVAKLALQDVDGAEADANQSNTLRPNGIAFTVLGDAAFARTKSYDRAKTFWLDAYNLGDRDDDLMRRLKDAGVSIPPPAASSSGATP